MNINASTSTSTTASTTTSEPVTTTTASHIASDDELCDWAVKDYQDKTGSTAVKAEITDISNGQYEITLTDENGKLLDVYTVDPITGVVTNSAEESVDLPQTGNNSLKTAAAVSAAFALMLLGMYAVAKSRILRRKENEQ